MKIFAIFALAITLTACNNAQSDAQRNIKTQFEQVAEMTKENLPLSIGEFMALVDVEPIEEGLTLKFTYQVADYDAKSNALVIEALKPALAMQNCNNDTFVPLYKDGASVIIAYETIDKTPIFELRFNEETCE